jgi:hypothetical protein
MKAVGTKMANTRPKVMAIASGGGHWTQMMRLRIAFEGSDSFFVSVKEIYRQQVVPSRFYCVPDVSRLHKFALFKTVLRLLWIIVRERPDFVVTTGSAPGMIALRIGKWFGARTVWIDSLANIEEMSLSGRKARACADLWLTQWPHLARPEGPFYVGSVL